MTNVAEPEARAANVEAAHARYLEARRALEAARLENDTMARTRWVMGAAQEYDDRPGEQLARSRLEPLDGPFIRATDGARRYASDGNGPALPHRREQARLAERAAREEYESAREEYFEACRTEREHTSNAIARNATNLAREQVDAAKALNKHTRGLKWLTAGLFAATAAYVLVAVLQLVADKKTPPAAPASATAPPSASVP